MTVWNHRIIKSEEGYYGIHEVFYDDSGRPVVMTEGSVAPFGETVDELSADLDYMMEALAKPVLEYPKDFDGKWPDMDAEERIPWE